MLTLSDGGEVALDWVYNDSSTMPSERRPTVIILPGLVGESTRFFTLSFNWKSGAFRLITEPHAVVTERFILFKMDRNIIILHLIVEAGVCV